MPDADGRAGGADGWLLEQAPAGGLTLVTPVSDKCISLGAESEKMSAKPTQRTNKTRKQLLAPGKTKLHAKRGELTFSKLLRAESETGARMATGLRIFDQDSEERGVTGEELLRSPRSTSRV